MGWLTQPIPVWLQWCALLATVSSAVLSLWAAISATGARKQAKLARQEAVRLARVTQLTDLIADAQELQVFLERQDFKAISAKCSYLRGRIARFKTEAYNDLTDAARASLDLIRGQIRVIASIAGSKRLAENKVQKIQDACAESLEALNALFAFHHGGELRAEENHGEH